MSKDYNVKKVQPSEETQNNNDTKIAANVVFSVASLVLAGVAFGVGDQIFGNTTLQYLAAFGCVGVTSANIKAMREKMKLKSGKTNNESTKSKGR